MRYEKNHDSVMYNIESLIDMEYSIGFLTLSNTQEYRDASNAIFKLFKALEEKSLTEAEEDNLWV